MLIYLALIGGAGIVFMILGTQLRKIARAREHERGGVLVTSTKNDAQQSEQNAFDALRVKLTGLNTVIPGIPPLPARPIDYEGWFTDVRKRMEMRSVQRTLDEQINTWRRYDDLYRQYLSLMKTSYALAETSHDFKRLGDRMSVNDAELKLKRKEIDIHLKELDVRDAELDIKMKQLREGKSAGQASTDEERFLAEFRGAIDGDTVQRIEEELLAKYKDRPETQGRIRRIANDICGRLMEKGK